MSQFKAISINYSTLTGSTIVASTLTNISTMTVSTIFDSTLNANSVRVASTITASTMTMSGSLNVSGPLQFYGNALIPVGCIILFYNSSIPAGWALCDGRTVTRTDGGGLIVTPNLVGQFVYGGTSAGSTGGSSTQTLSVAQLPAHNHGVSDPGHGHGISDPGHGHSATDSGHTHSDAGHSHTDAGHRHYDSGHTHTDAGHTHTDVGHAHQYGIPTGGALFYNGCNTNGAYNVGQQLQTAIGVANLTNNSAVIQTSYANISTDQASIQTNYANIQTGRASISVAGAGTGVSVNGAYTGITTQNTGSNASFSIMPPYIVLCYIMKY